MVRTQIQLTEDQVKALKKIAVSRQLSVDTMIKTSTAADPEDRRKRALESAGKFSSGRSDVSKKHDAYLSESFSR
jgi:hypothetical protein